MLSHALRKFCTSAEGYLTLRLTSLVWMDDLAQTSGNGVGLADTALLGGRLRLKQVKRKQCACYQGFVYVFQL